MTLEILLQPLVYGLQIGVTVGSGAHRHFQYHERY
jgi:hypothetical protein